MPVLPGVFHIRRLTGCSSGRPITLRVLACPTLRSGATQHYYVSPLKMLLPREHALRFIDGYKAVLLRVLEEANKPTTSSIDNDLVSARSLIKADRGLLEVALTKLEGEGKSVEPKVASAIRTLKVDQWVYLHHTKTYAVFLDKAVENAFAVRALTTPLYELWDDPPFVIEAGLLEYEGHYICDGLFLNPFALGPNYRSQLKSAHARLRKAGKFYTNAGGSI